MKVRVAGPLVVAGYLLQAGCAGTPPPKLVERAGDPGKLRGVTRIALSASEEDVPLLEAELKRLYPAIVFTAKANAQVVIWFHEDRETSCGDCGPDRNARPANQDFTVEPVKRLAVARVERLDDEDHSRPPLLTAEWQHRAFTRKSLVRAFVASLEPYLRGP